MGAFREKGGVVSFDFKFFYLFKERNDRIWTSRNQVSFVIITRSFTLKGRIVFKGGLESLRWGKGEGKSGEEWKGMGREMIRPPAVKGLSIRNDLRE